MQREVTEAAVFARVNRRLQRDCDHALRRTREGSRARLDLGEYFSFNTQHNCMGFKDICLEAFARELGVLGEYEKMLQG